MNASLVMRNVYSRICSALNSFNEIRAMREYQKPFEATRLDHNINACLFPSTPESSMMGNPRFSVSLVGRNLCPDLTHVFERVENCQKAEWTVRDRLHSRDGNKGEIGEGCRTT